VFIYDELMQAAEFWHKMESKAAVQHETQQQGTDQA